MADTITTTSSQAPEWLQPYLKTYMDRAFSVADQPFQQYQGQRVADLNSQQQTAMDAITNRAMSGNPVMNAAQGALQGIAGGQGLGAQAAQNQYLTQQNANVNAFNPYANVQNTSAGASNPYLNAQNANAGAQNPYLSAQNPLAQAENPYLQQQIDAASSDTMRNYSQVVRPQMDAAMAQSGSFGNSGLQQVQANQQTDLGKQLGNIASGMRMQDYTQRQGLQENATNRLFQGGQTLQGQQYGAGQQLAQNQYLGGAQLQNQQFNAGQQQAQNLYGAGQQQAQNQFNAGSQYQNQLFTGGQAQASAQNQMFQNQQANQMQALSMAPQYAAQDYTDAGQLMNIGNTLQNQRQAGLNADYGNWQQAQQYPQQQLGVLGQALGMNYGQTNTSTQSQGGGSTWGNAAGGALAGYGATGSPWGAALGGLAGLLG